MLTNTKGIPLPLAVMVATDSYDYSNQEKTISATTLLRSVKSILLSQKVATSDVPGDLSTYVPSRMGTALHEAMELAWKNPDKALERLGYNSEMISKIKAAMSLEVRTERQLDGWTVTGKYDCVLDGTVYDLKSTSVWKWVFKDFEQFQSQLSIYKWLNPEIITSDYGKVMFWFTDWAAREAKANNDYPQFRIAEKTLPLSLNIESFISKKLAAIDSAMESGILPMCTDKELWRKPDKWAYYSKSTNKSATKVFDNPSDAHDWMADKRKGEVRHRPGEVVACAYCNAVSICEQAEGYILSGELKREIV